MNKPLWFIITIDGERKAHEMGHDRIKVLARMKRKHPGAVVVVEPHTAWNSDQDAPDQA